MDPTQIAATASILRDAGITGAVIFALVAGARGWYIWRNQHDQIVGLYKQALETERKRADDTIRERDRWMATAVRGTMLAERAIGTDEEEAYDVVRSSQDRRARVSEVPSPPHRRARSSRAEGE